MMTLEQVLALAQPQLREALGGNLVSLTLIGSAAAGDFVPAASDINLLLVLRTLDLGALDRIHAVVRRLAKHRLSAPLVLSVEDIARSADVFPIEFLDLEEKRKVLFGPDPLAKVKIGVANLRHECEHELKGRLIRMRETYLEIGDHPGRLRALLLAAHAANFAVLRAALRLKRRKPPLAKADVLAQVCAQFKLDPAPFTQLQSLRDGKLRLGREGLRQLFGAYINEVAKLARIMDRW